MPTPATEIKWRHRQLDAPAWPAWRPRFRCRVHRHHQLPVARRHEPDVILFPRVRYATRTNPWP